MEIVYEDDSIIVCHKPAGMPTQTKAVGVTDLESELKKHRAENGEPPEVFVVHRLDQPVEGVIVLAKTSEAASKLSKQVTDRIFTKKYYAIITRESFPDEGTLEDYLLKDTRTNTSKVVQKSNPRAKKATLDYKVVDRWDDRKLLEIVLHTGRHHQIRTQLASRTAPILGDVKYGGIDTKRPLALCSHYIGFVHPKTGEKMSFDVKPKGEDFKDSSII